MADPNNRLVFLTWSGGMDSTALMCKLLEAGYIVQPVSILFGGEIYVARERAARKKILEVLDERKFFFDSGCELKKPIEVEGYFLENFEVGGVEQFTIPRRNRIIIDYMMANFVIPSGAYYLAMGLYRGDDTPIVKHVAAEDSDVRYMQAYFTSEYGIGNELLTCASFGETRTKADRLRMFPSIELANVTVSCGNSDSYNHCGACYNCASRRAAFDLVFGEGSDSAIYNTDISQWKYMYLYRQHMRRQWPIPITWDESNA